MINPTKNIRWNCCKSRKMESGLSMVELMVAITVGMILLAGLMQIFINNKQAYRLQDNIGVLQENGRFAMETLTGSIKLADHWGGTDANDVDQNASGVAITGIGSCNEAWILDVTEGVRGYSGAANIGSVTDLPSSCIAATDYVANTDLVAIRYSDGRDSIGTGASATSGDIYLRSAIGTEARIIDGSAGAPTNIPDQDGTYSFPYRTELYFVRPCAIKSGTTCNDGIPTLSRLTLSGSTLVQEGLIEGVEQLKFEYGSDSDSDGNVDRYDYATAVPDWDDVVNVRASMLVRSDTKDSAFTDAGPYVFFGDASNKYNVPSADQNYHRKQYTRLITIRNR